MNVLSRSTTLGLCLTMSATCGSAASARNEVLPAPRHPLAAARAASYFSTRASEYPMRPATKIRYYGGPVLEVPAVYVILWGFKAAGDPDKVKTDLLAFLRVVGGSSWENTITQYYGPSGHISDPKGQLMGVWEDDTNPIPRHPSDAQVAAEAGASVAVLGYNPNGAYFVATAHNHNTNGFGSQFCAYHSETSTSSGALPYINLGYMPDAGANCGAGIIPNAPDQPSADEGVTIVAGGEYADTITDPMLGTGWSPEIGSLCGFFARIENVRFGKKAFALGGLWSNAQNGCVF